MTPIQNGALLIHAVMILAIVVMLLGPTFTLLIRRWRK